MSLRIVLDARRVADFGIGTYIRNLVHSLAKIDTANQYALVTNVPDVPEFKAQKYLVDSTKSLEKAKFLPPDPNLSKITTAIQKATGRVANGDSSADDAAKQYSADLKQAIGADKVVEQ